MTVQIQNFIADVALTMKIHNAYGAAAIQDDLDAIGAALGGDTTTHDWTIETPPAGLTLAPTQSRFYRDVLLLVNTAKGGNILPAAMVTAFQQLAGHTSVPVNINVPHCYGSGVTGGELTCTMGEWAFSPTSYAFQWTSGGTNVAGETNSTYVVLAAAVGKVVACKVTATNATGSTPITSNGVNITA